MTDRSMLPVEVDFFEEKGLLWGDQYVANFEPRVTCLVESTCEGVTDTLVRFKCAFTDGTESDVKTKPLSELEAIKWHDVDMRCYLNPDCNKAPKYLAAVIRADLPSVSMMKEYHIDRLGLHFIGHHPAFCIGDRIILSPNADNEISTKLADISNRLAIDTDRSEQQAVAGMMRAVNLSPDAGRAILAHCLLNIMRSVYTEIDKAPRCILFLVGLTGTKKTTYASLLTQMYDRDRGIEAPTRLNASIPAAEAILHSQFDCVVVLDDLFPAKSSETKRNQERTLIELVRVVGDNSGRAIKKGNEVVAKEPHCGVLVTGEYLVGTGSDAARLLPVRFTTPIDNTKLSQCQREPLMVSTFYFYFITWFISNYYDIRNFLADSLSNSRGMSLGVHDRLQETHFCLESAYKIFLLYCVQKGFTSPENAGIQHRSFRNLLTTLVREQDERVRSNGDDESIQADYLGLIRALYGSNKFRLADNISELKEKHHGLIHDGHLCLRGKKLMEEILKLAPNTRIDEVASSLSAQNALKEGKDKRSIQISGGGGKRFYAIPLKKLK